MFNVANGMGMMMVVGSLLMVISGLGGLVTWCILHRNDLR